MICTVRLVQGILMAEKCKQNTATITCLTYRKLAMKASKKKIVELANSIYPDEVAHDEPPHLDLYCLPPLFEFSILYHLNKTFFEI